MAKTKEPLPPDPFTYGVQLHAPLNEEETIAAGLPDFNAALVHYFKEISPGKRGDEHQLHVSDLGKCRRAIWYRRNSAEATINPVRLNMEHGFWIEEGLGKILNGLEKQGWEVTHHAEIIGGTPDKPIIGHLDHTVYHPGKNLLAVVEDKSRRYVAAADWDFPRIDHRLQSAGYSVFHEPQAQFFGIIQWCNTSSKAKITWFETAPWVPIVYSLYNELSITTKKGAPFPLPAYPEMPYKTCDYCDYRQCEFNSKKEDAF